MPRWPENLGGQGGLPDSPDADVRPEQLSALRAILLQRMRNLPPNQPSSPSYGDSPRAVDHSPDAKAAANVAGPVDDRDTSVEDLEPSFRARVPEFQRLRDQHLARWPELDKSADRRRPDDPPGSWRGDGGRYLSPEQNAEAAKLIAGLREHEETITAELKEIEKDNAHGGVLVGLSHRLKGDDRLKEKIADKIAARPGIGVQDAVQDIWDAVRYTFRISSEVYAVGEGDIEERLLRSGFELERRGNRWPGDPEYKGINTQWVAPGGGRLELQFHTPDSHFAKEHLTHKMYERLRSTETSPEELRESERFQRDVCAVIPVPPGVAAIRDYQRRS